MRREVRAGVPVCSCLEVVTVFDLSSLGFGPTFLSQLSLEELSSLVPGRVVAELGPVLRVRFADGERTLTVPGRLRADGALPVAGDFVLAPPGGDAVVRLLDRATRLSRGAAGRETAEQVLAANVDLVFVVQGLDEGPHPRRLERTLAAVHAGGAEPVVVLTKPDLAGDPAGALAVARAAAPGAEVLCASGLTGVGVGAIAALLAPGRTGVFVGPSGAGKSTLVNALLGEEAQRTAEVRASDARGRHTTTSRRLFTLPGGGAVIDGPGIRELKLWDAAGLEAAFEDVAALAERCRFTDCRHDGEPGCAVEAAVADGRLDPARLASHRKLQAELAHQALRRDAGAARAERQRWKVIHRAARRHRRERGR